MANVLPPVPPGDPATSPSLWKDWFTKLTKAVNDNTSSIATGGGGGGGSSGGSIDHNMLQNLQGGVAGQYYHLTQAQQNLVSSLGTPTAGGVAYGTGTAINVSSAGTVGQVLTSQGSGAPVWAAPTGSAGPQGPMGPAVFLEAPEADEPFIIPGPRGADGVSGSNGAPGAIGPAGPAVFLEADYQEQEMFLVPGPKGDVGATGAGGALGYWGGFWDTTNQTALANTPTVVNINSADAACNGVSIVGGNRITFQYAGVYTIAYSLQYTNSDSSIHTVNLWFRLNDSGSTGDIPFTDSTYSVPNKHGSDNGDLIAATTYTLKMNAGDFLQLVWATDSNQVSLSSLPASVSPIYPASPCVVLSVSQVMYTQQGPMGPQGADGDQGDEGPMGPPGQPGAAGAPGATGAQGPVGPAVFFLANDGEDGQDGRPGLTGPQGNVGPQGPAGPAVYLEAPEADEPFGIPGPSGAQGIQGIAGPTGPAGPAIFLEADYQEQEMFLVPGPAGASGSSGSAGVQGPVGPAVFLEAPEADEPMVIPGPMGNTGPTGLLAFNGGKTATTAISATTTYTTGGVTLASQTALVGQVWRVRAFGTFVAVSSATARNAQIACYWGTTQLTAVTAAVLTSTAQTTNWEAEFILTASSTTAVWTTGFFNNNVASATARVQSQVTPASTTVTAGPQTLDLRFSMSVAVATDQWVIHSVTLERLK